MKPLFKLRSVAAPLILGLSTFLALPALSQQAPAAGDVYAWGENFYGAVGNNGQYDSLIPLQTLGPNAQGHLTNIKSVSAGIYYNLALGADGTAWAWGRNLFSTLGDNSYIDRWTPVQVHGPGNVGFLTNVVSLDAGFRLSVAATADGSVYQWGILDFYSVPGGQYSRQAIVPEKVPGLSGIVQVASTGVNSGAALKNDGTVWLWDNLNTGQTNGVPTPTPVVPVQAKAIGGALPLTGITAISASSANTENGGQLFALQSDGTVVTVTKTGSVLVQNLWNVVKIKDGVALRGEGTVWPIISPLAPVPGLTNVVDISNGIAARSDGTVWTWGSNQHGNLGTGQPTTTVATDPVQVPGLTNIFSVSASTTDLALRNSGTNPPPTTGGTNPPPTTGGTNPPSNTAPIARGNVSAAGEPGDWPSFNASLSSILATGEQYLAFVTAATHLLPGDTGWMWNIGVKNLKSGSLVMADSSVSGVPANSWSFFPSISADGSKVAFTSYGNNLTAGDNNGAYDVFVKNLKTNEVQLASSDAAGVYSNGTSGFYGLSLSGDGNTVAFSSYANNLVPGYGSGFCDVYVKTLTTGKVVRANTSATGALGNYNSYWPSITTDGSKVAFVSWATNLVPGDTNNTADIFVKTVATGAIIRLTPTGVTPNGFSTYPAISGNGRYVVFASQATNLVAAADANNGFDVYLADLQTGAISLVSTAASGSAGNGVSWAPSISADGRYIAFYSLASDLVAGDTNGASDVFVKDTQTGAIWRADRAANGDQANGGRGWDSDTGFAVSLSPDGQSVGFDSGASNLVPDDMNGVSDVFVNNLIH